MDFLHLRMQNTLNELNNSDLETEICLDENGTIMDTGEENVCEEDLSHFIIEVDFGDGLGYYYEGNMCTEHYEAMVQQFQDSCP